MVREIAAVLIASGKTLSVHAIASACRRSVEEVRGAVEALKLRAGDLGLRVEESGPTGVRVVVDGTYRRAVRALHPEAIPSRTRLSPEAAETLALLQEKGPMTLGEIRAWRGCNARNAIETLEKIGFVAPAGRAKGRGGPIRFGATALATLSSILRADPVPPLLLGSIQERVRLADHVRDDHSHCTPHGEHTPREGQPKLAQIVRRRP